MNISALIPARISSRRLPQKNIKKLKGKPLLFWSIDVALKVPAFNTVCVSTESQKVADLVRKFYSEEDVSVLNRPKELATDKADLRDVCRHFLDKYEDVDMLCLMMPTYPFRDADKINHHILPAVYSGQVARVISIVPETFCSFDYWIKTGNNYVKMFKTQPLWCEAGNAAYSFMKRDAFYKEPHAWDYDIGERELKVYTDFNESIDIDTENDFKRAEQIIQGNRHRYKKVKKEVYGEHAFIVPEAMNVPEFKSYLLKKGCNLNQPVLVLKSPPPYFTFLRWPTTLSTKNYQRRITREIIASLPTSGHSQDLPEHFIHSSRYRVLRIDKDRSGIMEESVPEQQVILYSELEKWPGFVAPSFWERG